LLKMACHTCPERIYHQYVFMMRNRDDDYDIPPTVIAATSDVEEAVDIAIDADQMIYHEEKVQIIRSMKLAELYMINDDILVWKTQSRQKRIIIWNLRQYLNRRVEDEFTMVWKAWRRYIDWVDNGMENDEAPVVTEWALLKAHMPYQNFHQKELTIAEMDELFMGDEAEVEMDDDDLYAKISVTEPMTPPGSPSPSRPPTPPRPSRKRAVHSRDDTGTDEDELVRAMKNTRLYNPFQALADELEDL
jgi:hypothetical protein